MPPNVGPMRSCSNGCSKAAEQYQRQAQEQFARRVDNERFARAQQFAKQTPDFAEVTDREDVIVPGRFRGDQAHA